MPEIGPLRDDELSLAFSLKQEYLDDSPFESWQIQRSTHPDLFLAARVDGHAIGICYGWPPDAEHVSADTIVLQGIAIAENFSGKCHGSQLLHAFESQVAMRGGNTISVGSAGGYVDHFYMKNGYAPTAFMICIPADRQIPPALTREYSVSDERSDGDLRRLYVGISRLDNTLRERLISAFDADEVIAIMDKDLTESGS